MTAAPPHAAHFQHEADVAAHIADAAAIVVAGLDADIVARTAVGIALAASAARRVAIGDLTGNAEAVYALAGGEDAPGLAESFRDGVGLNAIARPVPGNSALFVLPAGEGVRGEPALQSPERWDRLIGGFGEAGGLLILVARPDAPVISVLGTAGAGLVWVGRARGVPRGITLAATVGAVKHRSRAWWRLGHGPEMALWKALLWVMVAAAGSGLAGIVWIRAWHLPNGTVTLRKRVSEPTAGVTRASASADTVALLERLGPVDGTAPAQYAIEVMAASTASNANSWLQEHANGAGLVAATIATVAIRTGSQGTSKWHKVMVGAWHNAAAADSAVAMLRRNRVVAGETGAVVFAPYAMLLADSASHERARAVMEVWRAKGLVPYALTQDDGSVRVYAGAFASVAEGITMAAMVHAAGGTPIVAIRTGRPD